MFLFVNFQKKCTLTITHVQGTLPYMAVDLLNPKNLGHVVHRLSHDLESLCMVLIHIVCFSYGPIGTRHAPPMASSHRISQWHHEDELEVLEDNKKLDLKAFAETPELFVNGYWAPIIPFMQQLVNLVYPGITTNNMDSSALTYEAFRAVLVAAYNHCAAVAQETDFVYNYAAFHTSYGSTGLKRRRPAEDEGQHRNVRQRAAITTAVSSVVPFESADE